MVLLTDGLNFALGVAAKPFRIRYYIETIGSVWDDDSKGYAQSGTDVYISGLFFSLDNTKGSSDQVLMEQGRIKYEDSKIFVNGSVETTSGNRVFTIAASGADQVYREIQPGVNMPEYFGTDIYKKIYVRLVPGGSLF